VVSIFSKLLGLNKSNAELAAMFKEDQEERRAYDDNPGPGQWMTIVQHDTDHRMRVLELGCQGMLKTAEDFYHAAMIMQHGSEPKDYMRAHVFAAAAAHLGHKPALWLSAASFDRLMQRVGQPQVFGTQFNREQGEPWTMEPIAEELLSDTIRQVFDVPALSENKKRLAEMNLSEP
jgi:hypothetical protein